MKKLFPLVAVAVTGMLLALVLIPENKTTPAFSLTSLQGKPVSDADLRGKVGLINFWSPSYPGCVSEIPKVIKTAKSYRGRDFQTPDIAQPINPPGSMNQYVRKYNLPFAVIFDGNKAAAQAFGTQVYPISFLIDKRGEILKTFVDESDFTVLYQEIDKELAKQSRGPSGTHFQTALQTNADTVVRHP